MEELVRAGQDIGLEITDAQQHAFSTFLVELQAWNAHTNLTAIRDEAGIINKHFIDSLTLIPTIPANTKKLVDIGTGAGFPGLVIAIMRPDIQITLVESVGKKTKFLEHMISTLKLTNVTIHNARAEDLAHDVSHRAHYDVVTARAVAQLNIIAEYAIPFLKIGGIFIAQKNAGNTEIDAAQNALNELGAVIDRQIPITIESLPDRQLIIVKKTKTTPEVYPRLSGLATKKPL